MSTAKEHGLLFSSEMVLRLLDGTKSQTRRPLTKRNSIGLSPLHDMDSAFVDPGPSPAGNPGPYLKAPRPSDGDILWDRVYCRYAARDTIWVRETFAVDACGLYHFGKADWEKLKPELRWKPGIHLPKEMSRVRLEIESIGLQRVQEITEEEADAEGISMDRVLKDRLPTRRDSFRYLWDDINEDRGLGWKTNCWVWVLRFGMVPVNVETNR